MTDEQIIETVKLCCEYSPQCAKCPLEDRDTSDECMGELLKGCLDLINRKNTEIGILIRKKEALRDEITELQARKTSAIKDFVKRFEKKIKDVQFTLGQTYEIQTALKTIEKEMVGE